MIIYIYIIYNIYVCLLLTEIIHQCPFTIFHLEVPRVVQNEEYMPFFHLRSTFDPLFLGLWEWPIHLQLWGAVVNPFFWHLQFLGL